MGETVYEAKKCDSTPPNHIKLEQAKVTLDNKLTNLSNCTGKENQKKE